MKTALYRILSLCFVAVTYNNVPYHHVIQLVPRRFDIGPSIRFKKKIGRLMSFNYLDGKAPHCLQQYQPAIGMIPVFPFS